MHYPYTCFYNSVSYKLFVFISQIYCFDLLLFHGLFHILKEIKICLYFIRTIVLFKSAVVPREFMHYFQLFLNMYTGFYYLQSVGKFLTEKAYTSTKCMALRLLPLLKLTQLNTLQCNTLQFSEMNWTLNLAQLFQQK